MQNILTKTLPTKIQICSGIFEPVTDFRASVEFEIMVENGEKDIFTLLRPYYPKGLPKNNEAKAAEAAIYLYMCGDEAKKDEFKPIKRGKRGYSFAIDSEAIYADFSRFYNIDLTSGYLHWWKFRALLMGLPNDSSFKERIYYRTCELKGLPKKEQKRIAEIRKEIEIKESVTSKITLEQRDKQMLDYVTKRSKEMKG